MMRITNWSAWKKKTFGYNPDDYPDLQTILQEANPDDEAIHAAADLVYGLLKTKQQKVRGGGGGDAAVGEPLKKMPKHALFSVIDTLDEHLQGIKHSKEMCEAAAVALETERDGLVAMKERIENILADM